MRKLSKDLRVLLTDSVKAITPEQLVDAKSLYSLWTTTAGIKTLPGSLSFSYASPAQGFGTAGKKVPHGIPVKANPGNVLLS